MNTKTKNLIKLIALLIIIHILPTSCNKNNVNDLGELEPDRYKLAGETNFLWCPVINVEKGDNEAVLNLINPIPFTEYIYPPTDPDYINIHISTNMSDFSLYKRVGVTTEEVKISNLLNDQVYYFMVSCHKKGFEAVYSDTVSAVPSKRNQYVNLETGIFVNVDNVSMSKDMDKISYIYNNTLFYRDLNTKQSYEVENNAGPACWSATSNSFVYLKRVDIDIYRHVKEIKIFDADNKKDAVLCEIDYNNFYAYSPQYSFDGNSIAFLSNEGNAKDWYCEIYTIDIQTKEKMKCSDFETNGFYVQEMNWSNHADEIYLSGTTNIQNYRNDIYKFNLKTKSLELIIDSKWDDFKPVLSPNNEMIAFSSDRTGRSQLWIYNMITNKYSQITGDNNYSFDYRYSNIQWLNNNEILITIFKDGKNEAVIVKI